MCGPGCEKTGDRSGLSGGLRRANRTTDLRRLASNDGDRALQQLPRFDLLGADTVGGTMPLCPPIGSSRNELWTVMEHASVTFEAMFTALAEWRSCS